MCGRYNLITDAQALVDFFEIEHTLFDASELQPRYNIAPSQDVPIIWDTGKGRELAMARWGLVPHWSKEEKPKYSTINARAETVAEKPIEKNQSIQTRGGARKGAGRPTAATTAKARQIDPSISATLSIRSATM